MWDTHGAGHTEWNIHGLGHTQSRTQMERDTHGAGYTWSGKMKMGQTGWETQDRAQIGDIRNETHRIGYTGWDA